MAEVAATVARSTGGTEAGPRLFACPACRSFALEAVVAPGVAARCRACGFQTDDLLSLVPVRPVSLFEMTFGSGTEAALRLAAFGGLLAFLLALLLAGR